MNERELAVLRDTFSAFLSHHGAPCPEADRLVELLSPCCRERLDFREVCENLYDGIHIADGEGRVLFINSAYTRTTGIRPEEVLGRKVADIEASRA